MRNESDELFASLDESIAAVRAGGSGARLQVSHLKCGAKAVWGRAGEAVARLEAARAEGLDVAADQYPVHGCLDHLATVLPPALQALGVDQCVAALTDPHIRDLVRNEIGRGISGWENVAGRPGLGRHPDRVCGEPSDWSGRSLTELADEAHADPSDLAFDALVADRLDVSVVIDCMSEPDVDAIMVVPWIAVCTDAGGRRPGHTDPRRRGASPTGVREHGSSARALRSRARGLVAGDRGRQTDLGSGGTARPA
jgi:N-acyl-D-aspartate/D-glutamate deacylase